MEENGRLRQEVRVTIRVSSGQRATLYETAHRYGMSYTQFAKETGALLAELADAGFDSVARVREVLVEEESFRPASYGESQEFVSRMIARRKR